MHALSSVERVHESHHPANERVDCIYIDDAKNEANRKKLTFIIKYNNLFL